MFWTKVASVLEGLTLLLPRIKSYDVSMYHLQNIYAATEAEPISLQFVTDSLEIKKSTIGFPVRHTEVGASHTHSKSSTKSNPVTNQNRQKTFFTRIT